MMMMKAQKICCYLLMQMVYFCGVFGDCNRNEYDRCVRIADPLVKEAHLVFPDNMRDIEMVCQNWNKFVDCIRKYTDKCFNDQQRRQFNKAVENPIESVHQMCSQPHYQSEYLRYAPCIKSTITEASHCGPQYSLLVEQVEQGGSAISKATLCCSHDKFKECVQRETRRLCDGGSSDGPAARFSNQIMEKALSFLQEQCFNYIPNSGDCATQTTDNIQPYSDPLLDTTLSEVYSPTAGREWSPSTAGDVFLGSRTRPASYGRASSWAATDYNTDTSPTPSSTTAWSFSTNNHDGISTQPLSESSSQQHDNTAWYPAVGASNINEVDEPNQQGLAKPKNNGAAAVATKQIFSLTVVATVLAKFC